MRLFKERFLKNDNDKQFDEATQNDRLKINLG